MDWTRMVMGMVLLLTPPQGIEGTADPILPVTCPPGPSICQVENLHFAITKSDSDNILIMYLIKEHYHNFSDATCYGYYTFVQEECDSGLCWKTTNLSNAKTINGLISTMGAVIAALLVLIMASTVAFIYSYGQKSNELELERDLASNLVKSSQVTPSKGKKGDYDNYVQGNNIKAPRVQSMIDDTGLHGGVMVM